jgi:hypothetical protein
MHLWTLVLFPPVIFHSVQFSSHSAGLTARGKLRNQHKNLNIKFRKGKPVIRKKQTKIMTRKVSVNIKAQACKYFRILILLYYENQCEICGLKYSNYVIGFATVIWVFFFKYLALQTESAAFTSPVEGIWKRHGDQSCSQEWAVF